MTTLRDLTDHDLDLILTWRNSPVVNEFLSDRLKTKTDVESWFGKVRQDPRTWLKLIQVDGAAVGYAAVESVDERNRKCELAVVVGVPTLWGTGVGKFVLEAMLRYAFGQLKMHRVHAAVCRGNIRSEKLVTSMNFRLEGSMREALLINGEWVDLLCYSLLESEYQTLFRD